MRSLLSLPVLALLLPTLILAAPLRHPVPGKPDPLPIDPNNPPPRDAGPAHPRSGPSDFRPASYPGQRKPRGQGDGTPQKPRDWKPAQPGDSKPGLSYRLPARRAPTDMRSKLDTTAPPPNKLPGRDDEQAERDRAPELVAASEKWIPAPPPPPPAGLPKPVDGEPAHPGNAKPQHPSYQAPNRRAPTDLRSEFDTTAPPPNKLPARDEQSDRGRIAPIVAAAEKWNQAPPPFPSARVPIPPHARPAGVEERDAEGC